MNDIKDTWRNPLWFSDLLKAAVYYQLAAVADEDAVAERAYVQLPYRYVGGICLADLSPEAYIFS